MALDKSTIVRPVLRKETVPVETLGGEIILRQLTLSEMLKLGNARHSQDDEIAQVLAWCAIDEQGLPLLSLDEWQAWGASCLAESLQLYEVVIKLTGLEKKTTPTG
jgi:hypothetical protein